MKYPMKRTMLIASLALASLSFATKSISTDKTLAAAETSVSAPVIGDETDNATANSNTALYNSIQLDKAGLKLEVFQYAMKGFTKLVKEGKIANADKITIADFSQPSTQKRLYVIDLEKKQLLFNSLVSHGRNSGTLMAKSFSNQPSSYKSSPGFYVTGETYNGNHGYSLRLDGLERNINDNARDRAIVMHGAPYANGINGAGFLGRSQGCPALPLSMYKPIISAVKGGTCLFIYTPDESYLDHSSILG
jgi:hypothetical protein